MNEIYHHGVPGMRWGVRRYQNKDGSLTPAGRKRAAKLESQYQKVTGKKMGENTNDQNKYKPRMTNEELKERTTRLRLENEYAREINNHKELYPKKVSLGRVFVNKIAKDVIVPAATESGKNYLKNYLDDIMGNNVKSKSEVWAQLAKDYENRQKIDKGQKHFKEGKYKEN